MPYFLPLQLKKLNNTLASISTYQKKLEYIKNQKRINAKEIKCLQFVVKNPFNYKILLQKKYPGMIWILHSYSLFAEEKIEYIVPKIFLIFKPLIKTIVQGRYIWIIRKEKIRFRKILIEKEREIKTEIHVDGNQIELNFNINEKATPQYFQIPEKKEIEQIETQTFFEIHNLMQGYKWISKITERMKDRDKIIALNNIRSDIIKIIKGLEIEEHIINNFIINYRLLKKDHPEAIHLITIGYKNLIIEKRQKKRF